MRKELDEKLVADYPELYRDRNAPMTQTAMCWGFECDDGWYSIIDTLSYALTSDYKSAKNQVQFWKEHLGKVAWGNRIGTQEDLDNAIQKLESTACPVAVQVKEKFGTLRFYVDRATEKHYNYIAFAEMMSGRVCEQCGDSGITYTIGWHRTLCPKHAEEEYGEEAADYRNKTGEWSEE